MAGLAVAWPHGRKGGRQFELTKNQIRLLTPRSAPEASRHD